jgi:hypothetical protein
VSAPCRVSFHLLILSNSSALFVFYETISFSKIIIQAFAPYLRMGRVQVLWIFNSVFRNKSLDLEGLLCAEYARFAVIILECMSVHIFISIS